MRQLFVPPASRQAANSGGNPLSRADVKRGRNPVVAAALEVNKLLRLSALPFLLLLPLVVSAQTPVRKVLIITSYDRTYPAVNILHDSISSTIRKGSPHRVDFFWEFGENFRIPDAKYEGERVDYLKRKYEGENINLIIMIGIPALDFTLKHESELFKDIPKIFYFHEQTEDVAWRLWPHVTGVRATLDLTKTLDLALRLHPETRKVVVVAGESDQDKYLRRQAQQDFRSYESKLDFTYPTNLTIDELKDQLAALPPATVVIYLAFVVDKNGVNYTAPESLALFAPVSKAPIYGISQTYLGSGIVGGSLVDFGALGRRTGEIGLRILAGEKTQNIPPETAANVTMFDWRELRRWQIEEKRLPPGSIVQFRQPTLWAQYKWYLIGAITVFLVEAGLIFWLLLIDRRRRKAEGERARFASLAQAERRHLEDVVSNIPGIVWEARIEPGTDLRKTTFISDQVEKMLGYHPEEWLSAPVGFAYSIMPEEMDRHRAKADANAVIASRKEGSTQFRWRTKDGRILWIDSHLSPILDERGAVTGLRGVALDVTERRLAEESLRQTRERSQAMLRAIPDVTFLQSRDGIYLDYHAKNARDLLVPPEAFLGKNLRDVLPNELATDLLRCFQRAQEDGEPEILEYKLNLHQDERWFEARIVRAGENLLSVVRDITERKRALNELRESEERFSKAFRANPQPMSITTVADGQYLDVNDSFLAMSGYSHEEVIGHTWLELRIWDTPGARVAFMKQLNEHGSTVNVETTFRTKSGEQRILLSSAELLDLAGEKCLLMASSDITARVQAQRALLESEERFRNMADTAPVMIWISGIDKHCTYFNQQWLDFTGRSMEQEMGDGWTEGVHPDDYERCLETYGSAFGARMPFRMEYRLRRSDGVFRWVIDSGSPRVSAAGDFLGYIGSCVDITDRRQSEEALRIAHEEVNRLKNQLQEENIYLREEISLERDFGEIVGNSDALKYVLFKIEQVAPTEATVLITGETGTGKELVARAIHGASARRERPLVKVNCAALSPTLIESELFGHEKGAFTGAISRKIGRFEIADGATLFLDEIGELPPELQAKLLRVIQEGEFERLGSSATIKVDVRIIAATNRNLEIDVKRGLFREDLWYRLNVFPITVPPLRQRREDIPPLVEHFVRRFSNKLGKAVTSVSPATMNSFRAYTWPGNVRELANVIERATITATGSVLRIADDFGRIGDNQTAETSKTLEEVERDYILRTLTDTGWRIEGPHGAALILGMKPSTLRTRIAKLGIQKPGHDFTTAAG